MNPAILGRFPLPACTRALQQQPSYARGLADRKRLGFGRPCFVPMLPAMQPCQFEGMVTGSPRIQFV